MRFDEARMRQAFFQCAQDRIESFDVTHLQNKPVPRRQLRQLAGVAGVVGNWFLDQQMFAPSKQRTRNFVMCIRRRRHRGGVNQFHELIERLRRARVKFFSNGVRFRKIDVMNRGKVRRGNFGVEPGVIAPDVTDPNNSDTKFFHHL